MTSSVTTVKWREHRRRRQSVRRVQQQRPRRTTSQVRTELLLLPLLVFCEFDIYQHSASFSIIVKAGVLFC